MTMSRRLTASFVEIRRWTEIRDAILDPYRRETFVDCYRCFLDVDPSLSFMFRETFDNWICQDIHWNDSLLNEESAKRLLLKFVTQFENSTVYALKLHTDIIKNKFLGHEVTFVKELMKCLEMESQLVAQHLSNEEAHRVEIPMQEDITIDFETLEESLSHLPASPGSVSEFQHETSEYISRWLNGILKRWSELSIHIESWKLHLRCADMVESPMEFGELQKNFSDLLKELLEAIEVIKQYLVAGDIITVKYQSTIKLVHTMLDKSFIFVVQPNATVKPKKRKEGKVLEGFNFELKWLVLDYLVSEYGLVSYCNENNGAIRLICFSDVMKPIASPLLGGRSYVTYHDGVWLIKDLCMKYYEKKRELLGPMLAICVTITITIKSSIFKDTTLESERMCMCYSSPIVVVTHSSQYEMAEAQLIWDMCSGGKGQSSPVNWSMLSKALSFKFKEACSTEQQFGEGLSDIQLKCLKSKIPDIDFQSDDPLISWNQFFKKDEMKNALERSGMTFQMSETSYWGWFYSCYYLVKECLKNEWNDRLILGFVTKEETQKLLQDQTDGTFILRFSETYVDCNSAYPRAVLSAMFVDQKPNSPPEFISANPFSFDELKMVKKSQCFGSLLADLEVVVRNEMTKIQLTSLYDHYSHRCVQFKEAFAKYLHPLAKGLDGYVDRRMTLLSLSSSNCAGGLSETATTLRSTSIASSPVAYSPEINDADISFSQSVIPATVSEIQPVTQSVQVIAERTDSSWLYNASENENNSNNAKQNDRNDLADDYNDDYNSVCNNVQQDLSCHRSCDSGVEEVIRQIVNGIIPIDFGSGDTQEFDFELAEQIFPDSSDNNISMKSNEMPLMEAASSEYDIPDWEKWRMI